MTQRFFRSFVQKESGSLSVEAVLLIPILAWAICATFVFFDAFKTLNLSQKATFAVADMLSREEVPVDDNYIEAMHEIFDYMVGDAGENAIRVSVVTRVRDINTNDEFLELVWSEGFNADGHADITPLETRIPTLSLGEQLIVVEGVQEWTPTFSVGSAQYIFREVALARPRFSAQICWEDASGCNAPSVGVTTSTEPAPEVTPPNT